MIRRRDMSQVHRDLAVAPAERNVELLSDGARLNLEIPCSPLAEYLRAIPEEKRIIAITHVIEVGLMEVARRRAAR
jgi:hypothetical protein